MRALWLSVTVLTGCYGDSSVVCGDLLCPVGKVCSSDSACVTQEQVDACHGAVDGSGCSYPGTPSGVCRHETCIPAGCGNSIVEPGEVCDDGNRVSFDGCRSDCLSTERCGDGVAEPALGEYCDCGDAANPSATCSGPNSLAPGSECRTDCRPARCGDGIVDPSELCDDGNNNYDDGCRADCAGRFRKHQVPTASELHAAWTLSSTDAWVVGLDGTVLHYNGSSWSSIGNGTLGQCRVVWASSVGDVYVGDEVGLKHFDGTSWAPVFAGTIAGIWGSAKDNVYVLDGNTIRHLKGTVWVGETACGHTGLTGIWGAGPSAVFVASSQGVCRYNGSTWSEISTIPADQITGTSATDVYTGVISTATITRWNGASWSSLPAPFTTLYAIGAAGPNDLLGTGQGGVILRYDGVSWTSIASPTEQFLGGIAASSSTNVFIVGGFGVVLH